MIAPYDHEALWMKAKLFLNRAMDDGDIRSFDEQALWASLALELLAKAALSRVSPLLIAEPTDDGTNMLIATGLAEGDARFTSVKAGTVFKRCSKAYKRFSQKEASQISNARNEYLHGPSVGFLTIPPKAWWPAYWAQAIVLISALDKSVEELVGLERVDVVNTHLEQNAKNVEHRTQTLIERAKQRLLQHSSGTLPVKVAAEWKPGAIQTAGLTYTTDGTCPACAADGKLEGEDVRDTDVETLQEEEDYYTTIITLTIDASYFSCPRCQLVLDGYELLEEAGLPVEFEVEGDEDDIFFEPEYGNE